MSDTTRSAAVKASRTMLSKVPEITVWFWVIKILCTTVGESFADWINMTLGVGLVPTAVIFTVVLAAALGWQLTLDRYKPFVYWLTVVVLSVTGTLYTDILTDKLGVPLAASSAVFAAILAVVFGVWFARERTLSIHSIITLPRELFYWLAILVTFALGTAVGDWTLEFTGWGPGLSVLLPAGLIIAIVAGWKLGANAVLSFWLAYILTRPLGANLGDWLGFPKDQQGLGLGVAITSAIFLTAILATVIYLTVTRADVIDKPDASRPVNPGREMVMLGYFAAVAVAAGALLTWANAQPHAAPPGAEGPTIIVPIAAGQAGAHFPATDLANFRTITQDILTKVQAGDQAGATAAAKNLETAWDDSQPTLKAMDATTWTAIDGRIDTVLTSVRDANPDPVTETQTLNDLLNALQ
ncbi:MAG: COG4705 family protein [Mycobacterium sp.]